MAELIPKLEKMIAGWKQKMPVAKPQLLPKEVGVVLSVSSGIARVKGLPGASYEELVYFESGDQGLVFDLTKDDLGVIVLGDITQIEAGTEVVRTEQILSVPVGEHLIGRVLNPLAKSLDNKESVHSDTFFPLERNAPAILDRSPVTTPLQTGIKVIDALIPIGRGQRELILGDRQIGKTAIALDTILNQKNQDMICIYCSIGQRSASVAKAIQELRDRGALEYTIVIVAEGNDPPGIRYLAPYSATSIAEFFMEQGRDVLIVYDDLTSHARAYRELSLLMRRPPGREAFPGDIFYIHSRLLERSTHLRPELGGGSLTALPIIETDAGDISAYIPTNLISITDGQIYLSPFLFEKGIMPAIDIGKSVSRVGGKAQLPAYHAVTASLKLAFSQFEELETFARFGTRLDEHTRQVINHGKRIRECLIQKQYDPLNVIEQIVVLLKLTEGLLDSVPLEKIKQAEADLRANVLDLSREIRDRILSGKPLDESMRNEILSLGKDVLMSSKVENDSN